MGILIIELMTIKQIIPINYQSHLTTVLLMHNLQVWLPINELMIAAPPLLKWVDPTCHELTWHRANVKYETILIL